MAYFFSRPWRDFFFAERSRHLLRCVPGYFQSRLRRFVLDTRKVARENSLWPRRHECHSRGPSTQPHDLRRSSSVGMTGNISVDLAQSGDAGATSLREIVVLAQRRLIFEILKECRDPSLRSG